MKLFPSVKVEIMIFHFAICFFLTNQNFHGMESLFFHLSAAEGRHVATKVDVEWRLSGIDLE